MTDNTHHCPICAEPFMADTPAQVALDEKGLKAAKIAYDDDAQHGLGIQSAIRAYLSTVSDNAGDDGQGTLVERLRAREDIEERGATIKSDEPIAPLLREAADRIEAITRENAALRADKERLERELKELDALFKAQVAWEGDLAECRLAEQGQAQGEAVASIVSEGCTGCGFVFDPGVLHVNKDGSGYIAIDEDDFACEDDRCEGPDGPEGSVHWIARLDASEMQALRDFLNGAPRSAAPPPPEPDAELVEALGKVERFINEPSQYEDQKLVSDYRHELYRVWSPLCSMILRRHRKQGGE